MPPKERKYELGFQIHNEVIRSFFAGCGAGIVVAYSTFPLEAWKKLVQAQVNRIEYKVPIWRGSTIFAFNIIPTTTLQMGTKNIVNRFVTDKSPITSQLLANIFCASMGSFTATFVENVIIRQQTEKNKKKCGPISVIQDMCQQGALRPWKSYGLIAIRDSIFLNWMFMVSPTVQDYVKHNYDKRYILPATLGTGILGAVLSHPFDTVATNMQKTHSRVGYWQTFYDLINNNPNNKTGKRPGFKALFRGVGFRIGLFTFFSNFIPEIAKDVNEGLEKGYFKEPFFWNRVKEKVSGEAYLNGDQGEKPPSNSK